MEISGKRISRDSFAAYMTQVADVIAAMTEDGYPHPTAFEIETAVAFLFFRNENCDLVLLEVGMGGNLDATNIIKNTLLAVLVSVSMDHMSFLGNTLARNRRKKSRHYQRRLSCGNCPSEAGGYGSDRTDLQKAPGRLYGGRCITGRDARRELSGSDASGIVGETYEIPLAGVYQKENAVVALNALKVLDTALALLPHRNRRKRE